MSAPVHGAAPTRGATARAWVTALRPLQWIKNGFVLTPLLFSGNALEWNYQWRAMLAFVAFSLTASCMYLINDVVDRHADREHPRKSSRPIPAGIIPVSSAIAVSVVLGAAGLSLGILLSWRVALVLLVYLALNGLYNVVLKNVVIVDVFAIASFFVLRLLAGAAAIGVTASIWLLLCGGLLALYLGFAKRRHELWVLGGRSPDHRAVLAQYTTPFLDQLSVVLLAVTVVAYIMYTVESETARLVRTDALAYSTVFVIYGVIRYLYLVHRREGGDPASTLLADPSLLLAVALWALYCGGVMYLLT